MLNPDMPAQELRLHMGELTADEMLVARAAIRWANSQAIAEGYTLVPIEADLSEFLGAVEPYLENERLNSIGLMQLGGLVVCFKDELIAAAQKKESE